MNLWVSHHPNDDQRQSFRFEPRYSVGYHLTQNVSGYAPPGEYSYDFKMVVLPDQVEFQDSFSFRKLALGLSLSFARVASWALHSWGNGFAAYWGQSRVLMALISIEYSLSQNYSNPSTLGLTLTTSCRLLATLDWRSTAPLVRRWPLWSMRPSWHQPVRLYESQDFI